MCLVCILKQHSGKGSLGLPTCPKGLLTQVKMHLQRLVLLSCVAFGQRLHHSWLDLPDLPLGMGAPGSLTPFPISWQKCPFILPPVGDQLGLSFLSHQPPGVGVTQRIETELALQEGDSSLSLCGPLAPCCLLTFRPSL